MKITSKILKYKRILIIVAILLLSTGGYIVYQKAHASTGVNKYVISAVEKGSIINSIAGSGQVSASNQIDIKPKSSGDLVSISIKTGQEVKSGAVIAQVDSSDAYNNVKDAQTSLESARLALEKLYAPANANSLLQAQNALDSAKNNLEKLKVSQASDYQKALKTKQDAEDNLAKAYEDGFSTVSNIFLGLPNIMTGLQDIAVNGPANFSQTYLDYYYSSTQSYDSNALRYRDDASDKYDIARKSYDKAFADYKSVSRYSDTNTINSLIQETYDTTKSTTEAIKSINNLIQAYKDSINGRGLSPQPFSITQLSSLSSYVSSANGYLSNISSTKSSIKNSQSSIDDANQSIIDMDKNNPFEIQSAEVAIKDKEASLAQAQEGPDTFDVRSQQISIQQKQTALAKAQKALSDYSVKAPVDGIIAEVSAKQGDSVSSGTTIATLVSKQKMAEVSLGETDITKVQVGQKATFTFDAIEGLTLTGDVAEVGTLGTTTQGVVSYKVKIVFNTDDDRIKTGMSFSVNITTESKTDVLVVPSSAIKASGNGSYVEVPNENISNDQIGVTVGIILVSPTKQQVVETGLTDGTNTEITSGLIEGDKIITKTIKPTTTSTSSSSTTKSTTQSLIGGAGGFGGGGATRIPTGTGGGARGN